MQITDAQIHLWAGEGAPPHHWRTPFTVEEALAEMERAGIDAALNHPPGWDQTANDYAAEAAANHPDKFATLDWFPLDASSNEQTAEACLKRPGVLGLRFVMAMPEVAEPFASGKLDWLWAFAEQGDVPVGLFVLPQQVPVVDDIASRFPKLRLMIDHLGVPPFVQLPDAGSIVDLLLSLAKHPNVAVKASGFPSMATDDYPFTSTHAVLRKGFDAFGAHRLFWGTDITRLKCSWRQCVTAFTEELDWLKGDDLELVMGKALRNWVGWPDANR